MAVGLPVHCPHCGAIFPSRAFAMQNFRNLTLSGNRESCPNCGEMANIIDGVFDANDDVLTLLKGPQFSRDLLKKFADLMERVSSQAMEFEEIKEAANEISPEIGNVVESLRGKPHWFIAMIFTMMLFALRNCHFDVNASTTVDVNQLFYQATHDGQMYVPPTPKPKVIPYNALVNPMYAQNSKKDEKSASPNASGEGTESKSANPPKEI